MQNFLLVIGVLVFAIGCRTFRHPIIRKSGALGIVAATFLAGYFLFGENLLAGIGAALLWVFLPWIDILTRIRAMRLPLDKPLRHRYPPSRDAFPHLAEFTEEVEEEGYVRTGDTGWDWDDMSQFVRVFYHEETKAQAGIYYNEQRHIAFTYIGISSRTTDGHVYTSWNFPFANTMRIAPQIHINRVDDVSTFAQLIDAHEFYLMRQQIQPADIQAIQPDGIRPLMEKELRLQIDHNLDQGLIRLSGNGTFRYSWRGLVFLWCQFLKDMVKLS
jgi:hypothetical protein